MTATVPLSILNCYINDFCERQHNSHRFSLQNTLDNDNVIHTTFISIVDGFNTTHRDKKKKTGQISRVVNAIKRPG